MFGHRFFGARYYAPRYFGDGDTAAPASPTYTSFRMMTGLGN